MLFKIKAAIVIATRCHAVKIKAAIVIATRYYAVKIKAAVVIMAYSNSAPC